MSKLNTGVLSAALLAAASLPMGAFAQTPANISVVQGNGQLVCDNCTTPPLATFDPLIVLVTDSSGNPVPNANVTWAVTSGGGYVAGSTTVATTTGSATGPSSTPCTAFSSAAQANGETCVVFTEGQPATAGFLTNTVTASLQGGQSVTFYLIQAAPIAAANNTYFPGVSGQLTATSLPPGSTISGPVNSVYATPIQIQILTSTGLPVPNVSVQLFPETSTTGPSISCQTPSGSNAGPGSVLTDTTGTGTCYPVFGPTAGSTPNNFGILVGGILSVQNPTNGSIGSIAGIEQLGPFIATATAVTPGAITVVSGNSQSALAGSQVTNPLVVAVTDPNNNPLAGQTVTWAVSPSGAATFSPVTSTSGTNGQASTTVTLASSASGTVTVTASVSGVSTPATFTITATQSGPTITGLSIVSGNSQTVPVGTAFAPIVVQVAPAISGVTVQFAVAGSGTLSASSATTGSNGQAQVTVTAGSTPGTVTVVATAASFSQTFNLMVTSALQLGSINFLNGAGFYPTSSANQAALSPCAIGTLVVGSSPLAASAVPVVPNMYTAPLQQTTGTTIAFPSVSGTSNASLLNIGTASTGQQLITFQVPCDANVSTGESVAVTINGSTTSVAGVVVRASGPGIFQTVSSDGVQRALAVRANGSFVDPTNPAQPGDFVTVYVTGLGATVPPLSTGVGAVLPQPGISTIPANPVLVTLNNNPLGAVTVTASPDLIGVFQVNFQIPTGTGAGDNILAVGSLVGQNPLQFQGGSKLYVQ